MTPHVSARTAQGDEARSQRTGSWLLPEIPSRSRRSPRMRWNIDDCIEFAGAVLLALVLAALVLAVV